MVRQVSGLTNNALALERNFLKLKGALEMMRSFDLRVAHLLRVLSRRSRYLRISTLPGCLPSWRGKQE